MYLVHTKIKLKFIYFQNFWFVKLKEKSLKKRKLNIIRRHTVWIEPRNKWCRLTQLNDIQIVQGIKLKKFPCWDKKKLKSKREEQNIQQRILWKWDWTELSYRLNVACINRRCRIFFHFQHSSTFLSIVWKVLHVSSNIRIIII